MWMGMGKLWSWMIWYWGRLGEGGLDLGLCDCEIVRL